MRYIFSLIFCAFVWTTQARAFSSSETPFAINPSDIPTDSGAQLSKWVKIDFLTRWEKEMARSKANGTLDEVLRGTFETLLEKLKEMKASKFSELEDFSELKAKLSNKKQPLTLDEAHTLLLQKSSQLTNADQAMLLTLLQVKVEKGRNAQGALNRVLKRLLSALKKEMGSTQIEIPENLQAALGGKALKISDLVEKLKTVSLPEKEGTLWGSKLLNQLYSNPERLDLAFSPISEFLFDLNNGPQVFVNHAEPFREASRMAWQSRVDKMRITRPDHKEAPSVSRIPLLSWEDSEKWIYRPTYYVPNEAKLPNRFPTFDDEFMKACIAYAREPENRMNVELRLPSAHCSASIVATNPISTVQDWQEAYEKNPLAECPLFAPLARHCVNGRNLPTGTKIKMSFNGASVLVDIEETLGLGEDLAGLVGKAPCAQLLGMNLTPARLPSKRQLYEILTRSPFVPLVMFQNNQINATPKGENRATIAAVGSFETSSNGDPGSFLRFDTRATQLNKSDQKDLQKERPDKADYDSDRIKPGDSGGGAATCVARPQRSGRKAIIEGMLYLGALSGINETNDRDEGKTGRIASGRDLFTLISAVSDHEKISMPTAQKPINNLNAGIHRPSDSIVGNPESL